MNGFSSSGSVRLAADSVIGVSGKPVRIFSATWLSGAGGAGELVVRAGTADTDSAVITVDGSAASVTTTQNFENGLLFPSGAFFDIDTNIDAVVFEIRVEA